MLRNKSLTAVIGYVGEGLLASLKNLVHVASENLSALIQKLSVILSGVMKCRFKKAVEVLMGSVKQLIIDKFEDKLKVGFGLGGC